MRSQPVNLVEDDDCGSRERQPGQEHGDLAESAIEPIGEGDDRQPQERRERAEVEVAPSADVESLDGRHGWADIESPIEDAARLVVNLITGWEPLQQ